MLVFSHWNALLLTSKSFTMTTAFSHSYRVRCFCVLSFVFSFTVSIARGQEPERRVKESWQKSKVRGTPDRPPPFSLKRAYPKLSFRAPISIHSLPDSGLSKAIDQQRLVVIEQSGKIWSFVDRDDADKKELMLDLASPPPKHSEWGDGKGLSVNAFSMAFHPKFADNRFVYVCYLIQKNGGMLPNGTHIARYRMLDTSPPVLDYASEETVLRFDSGGHNGCTLAFGPDGYLYISIGDSRDPTPPDPLKTGQDISDLFSSILRIDVDNPSVKRDGTILPYRIPKDNPFVGLPNARGEVFAYGLRNPWRMSFDQATGELWVGDVGWEAYEMVYRVRSGGNYGWSIKEGPGDVMPDAPIGPTPILPPDITLSHADAASVTGGIVYRGKKHAELVGNYVFGDWITRRFWAASFDEKTVLQVNEIAGGEVKPICFATDSNDELLVLEYIQWDQDGGIYRFVPNPGFTEFQDESFPKRLAETGLFKQLSNLEPNAGVYTYSLNAPMWMDGAKAEFHVAVPGPDAIQVYQSAQPTFDWFNSKVKFPKDTVLVKTYYLEQGEHKHRIESQLSHYGGVNDWRFYSYRWLDDQSDAVLVGASGESRVLKTEVAQDFRWNYAARSQCRICHTPWSGDALGFIEEQLRRPELKRDSWRDLQSQGATEFPKHHDPRSNEQMIAMASHDDATAGLDRRARSYLHSNCAHCHQFGGSGSAAFDVRFDKSMADTKAIDAVPLKGDCQLEDAKLIAPGEPYRSVLYYRLAKSGSGRMPHIGAELVDIAGAKILHEWISGMPKNEKHRNFLSTLSAPQGNIKRDERLAAARELLASNSGAMLLANALADRAVPSFMRDDILSLANQSIESSRDLLEPFLPAKLRVPRLGTNFDHAVVLRNTGDELRGKEWVLKGGGQCLQCHRFGDQGKEIGPALENVGSKFSTPELMLEHLIYPSLLVAPEYRSISILTADNETIVGRVLGRTEKEVEIMIADGSRRIVQTSAIELERENKTSLMPQGVLASMTAQQASDLIAFLLSQKGNKE